MHMKKILIASAISSTLLLSGCSFYFPNYVSEPLALSPLQKAEGTKANVGQIEKDKSVSDSISLRLYPTKSPYDDSFVRYLEEALKQDLNFYGIYDPNSPIEITGIIKKNDIDVSGLTTAPAEMEVAFVVRKGNQLRYNKSVAIHYEFPSHFTGAVAIQAGIDEYPKLVSKLLSKLYSDSEFINALK